MTPTEIRKILAGFGGGANKRLGQHFLMDKKALETMAETADIRDGDLVLEVGPGLGVLTGALIDRGAEVVAIEQDRRFVEYLLVGLRQAQAIKYSLSERSESKGSLRIIQGDAAIVHWHELVGERPWKFVSNLPYGITSLALRKALYTPKPPSNLVVLVQREVAERAIAISSYVRRPTSCKQRTGKTSLLSLMVALASSSARIVRRVPAGAFYPPPKVESAILHVVPLSQEERMKRWGMEPEKIMEIARQGFAHPRKLLKSNLVLRPASHVLENLGIDEKARAEDLSPDDWARLAKSIR